MPKIPLCLAFQLPLWAPFQELATGAALICDSGPAFPVPAVVHWGRLLLSGGLTVPCTDSAASPGALAPYSGMTSEYHDVQDSKWETHLKIFLYVRNIKYQALFWELSKYELMSSCDNLSTLSGYYYPSHFTDKEAEEQSR